MVSTYEAAPPNRRYLHTSIVLAQAALGSFGVLHAELGLHTDPRFGAVQDALVQLSMMTGRLAEWLPPFLAERRAELSLLELGAPLAEEEAVQGALSPELARRD